MKTRFLLPTGFFLLCSQFVFSQGIRSTQSIGINDISIIEMANNGDIWVGSNSQGVAFYNADSAQWNYFDSTNTPALKSNRITSLALTPVGGVFHTVIGTANGGCVTQPGPWDTLTQVSGLALQGISYRPDSLWVLSGNTVIRYDSSFNHIQNYTAPLPAVSCVAKSPAGCTGFWAGTAASGCFYTSNGINYTVIDTSIANKKLVDNRVNAIAVDLNCDRIFVGTKGGFSVCPTAGPPCQNFTTANGLPQNDITSVVVGCNQQVWLGTRDSGIVVFNPQSQQFNRITTVDGLTDNRITALAISADCDTYAGSKDGSIAQLDSSNALVAILSSAPTLPPNEFGLSVYPQPAAHEVQFVFDQVLEAGEIHLADITGRIVQQVSCPHHQRITLDVSALPTGLYFFSIYRHHQFVKSGRIEVAR